MSPGNEIALLIPAYNAESTLGEVLESVKFCSLPILVVNDGSTDRTEETARKQEIWQVVSHPENRGKGAALKTGFSIAAEAGFTHVLTFDADGQHPVESIPLFLETCQRNNEAILVGNRFSDDTIANMPRIRRISNGLSSALISWAAGTSIPDAQCGMRIYPLWIFETMHLESDGYALETEVLVKAGGRQIEVENIPISCHYPAGTATSRYRALRDSWRIGSIVVRCLLEDRKRA